MLAIAFAIVALNALAFMHARAMTHFTPAGQRMHADDVRRLSFWRKAGMLFVGFDVPRPKNLATPADYQLPYQTHPFRAADGVDLEAWYVPADESPKPRDLVIIFHGYISAKAAMLGEADAFHRMGYDTMLVDFRGSGGSSGNVTTIGYRESLEVAAAVGFARQHLSPAPRRIILYGQSMGSVAILRAIGVDHVDVDAAILECPFDRLTSAVTNRFAAMGVPHAPAVPLARLLIFWGSIQEGYWGFAHNPCDYASHVRCPVLLMHGAWDSWVLRPEIDCIFNRLAGEKQFVEFDKCGHQPYRANEPEKWAAAVRAFLKQL